MRSTGLSDVVVERGNLPWDYTELTEIYVERDPAGLLLVDCALWVEPRGMRFRCKDLTVSEVSASGEASGT